jgi:3-hydroxy-9,10-secoandrosta-1,3,5(10)-triene-9,17-dione monooxygenase
MTASEHRDRPSHTELVARAVALQPLLREHAGTGEAERRIADPVAEALTHAGLFRMFTPSRFGGYEANIRTAVEVVETLAQADASAAWLVSLATSLALLPGYTSEQTRKEIFSSGPDIWIAGGGMPTPARRVDGGLQVSGRWSSSSGSHHATWAAVGAIVNEGPDLPAAPFLCLVPTSQLQLEDTWRTVGMRGTGSNTWAGEDVYIPEDRMIPIVDLIESKLLPTTDEPMYRVTPAPTATLFLLAPILGVGRAALALAIENAPVKPIHQTCFTRQSDSVGVQIQVAQAALKLQTAQLHAYSIADQLDRCAADGGHHDYADRGRFKAMGGYAAQETLEAIHILLNVHGAGSFAETNRMQQYWRDANTAARHAGLNAVVGREVYGKSLLGVEERISLMV